MASEQGNTPRELDGEEALLAAASVVWDGIPPEHRKEIYKRLPGEKIADISTAINAGRKLRREGGATK